MNATATDVIPGVEAFLGSLTLVCFLVGVPGNLLATIYFVQEHLHNSRNTKKLYFTELYISMTTVDLVLTVTLFPLFENYFNGHRLGSLFASDGFCLVWGFLWEIAPCISVFLVGILSISRMLILVRPMQALNLNVLRAIIGTYACYHLLMRIALWFADNEPFLVDKIKYTDTTGYCFFYPKATNLWYFNAFHAGAVLGLPIIPISLSFLASLVKLRESATSSTTQKFSRAAQTQATVTIIIVTSVYLVCNLPIFLNYCYYTHIIVTDDENWTKYYDTYTGAFWGYYIWNLTVCDLVALNGAINPIVFFLRMKPFRDFIKALLPIKNTIINLGPPHLPGKSVKEVTTSSF